MEGKNFLYNIIGILIFGGAGYIAWRCGAFGSRVRRTNDVSGQIRNESGRLESENNKSTESIRLLKDSNNKSGKLANDIRLNNTKSKGIIARARDLLLRAKKKSMDK